MIRKFSLFMGALALVFVFVAGAPFLAEADVFVPLHAKTNKSDTTKKKNKYFLSPKKSSSSSTKDGKSYYKKKTLISLNRNPPKMGKVSEADPYLLSMAGPDRRAKDVLVRAQAYRLSKAKRMLEIQRQDSYRVSLARDKSERFAAAHALEKAKGPVEGQVEEPAQIKKKTPFYKKTIRNTIQKPRKVFNSSR